MCRTKPLLYEYANCGGIELFHSVARVGAYLLCPVDIAHWDSSDSDQIELLALPPIDQLVEACGF